MPLQQRKKVDYPEPLAPMTAVRLPRRMDRDRSFKEGVSPLP